MAVPMAIFPVQCDSHAVLPPVQPIVERIPLESEVRSGITVVQYGKPLGVRNLAMARLVYATYGSELDPTYDHTSPLLATAVDCASCIVRMPQVETFDIEVLEAGIAHRLYAKEGRH